MVTIEIKEKDQHSNNSLEKSQFNAFWWNITYLATEMFHLEIWVVTIEIKEKHQHSNTSVEISQWNKFDEL